MTDFKHIAYYQHGSILAIIFNRPEAMNALSPELIEELLEALTTAASDKEVQAIIVTGAGEAWSAGLDLKAMKKGMEEGTYNLTKVNEAGLAIIHLIQTMPKPVVAAVNGHCYTGAMELMMAFDCIIASEEAMIGDTHAKWGILPGWGMTQRLSQLVGPIKARELSFTCEPISGKEAARIGLVNKAVPLEILDETVGTFVRKILQNSQQTIAAMKGLYYQGEQGTLREGLKLEQAVDTTITDRIDFYKDFEKNK